MEIFLKGLVVGLAISVPMGPVGVFVVHRVIAHSKLSGIIVGLGSITADMIFGVIAIYGLTTISKMIDIYHKSLSVFGGVLLLFLAINIFFSKPKERVTYDAAYTYPKDFITGFILTITNPLTVIAVLALFAWFGLNGATTSLLDATILLAGFVAGLILWWLGIVSVISHLKKKVDVTSFRIVNQVFGLVLLVLAILVLVKVI